MDSLVDLITQALKHMSQTQLGDYLGVSQPTINAWKKGALPRDKQLPKYIDLLKQLGSHNNPLLEEFVGAYKRADPLQRMVLKQLIYALWRHLFDEFENRTK